MNVPSLASQRRVRMDQIVQMTSDDPVYTVIKRKWECIRDQELSMDHDEEREKSVTMQLTFSSPFLSVTTDAASY